VIYIINKLYKIFGFTKTYCYICLYKQSSLKRKKYFRIGSSVGKLNKKFKQRLLFMVAKTGLVVPLCGMSLSQTDGSLIGRALKSCKSGVLLKRNQCGFFVSLSRILVYWK